VEEASTMSTAPRVDHNRVRTQAQRLRDAAVVATTATAGAVGVLPDTLQVPFDQVVGVERVDEVPEAEEQEAPEVEESETPEEAEIERGVDGPDTARDAREGGVDGPDVAREASDGRSDAREEHAEDRPDAANRGELPDEANGGELPDEAGRRQVPDEAPVEPGSAPEPPVAPADQPEERPDDAPPADVPAPDAPPAEAPDDVAPARP
jgi:hypothetical protein